MIIEFFVPCLPTAKGRPRFARRGNFVQAYTPAKTQQAEYSFLALAMAHKPTTPIDAPIELTLEFYMPKPQTMTKKLRAIENLSHTKKPDIDNLTKLVVDSLNGIFWVDDSRIWHARAFKVYADNPGVRVRVEVVKP
jgi:Holliday junction resolvase RusA-like endonuclease